MASKKAYYRVLPKYDQACVISWKTGEVLTTLIGNELFTVREANALSLNVGVVEQVNLNPRETYFMFGVRRHDSFVPLSEDECGKGEGIKLFV